MFELHAGKLGMWGLVEKTAGNGSQVHQMLLLAVDCLPWKEASFFLCVLTWLSRHDLGRIVLCGQATATGSSDDIL